MTVSKADLLKQRFGVEDFEIQGVGTVKIRPLTRAEVLRLRGHDPSDVAKIEQIFISSSLVEPKLSEADVAEWQENSAAGELGPLTDRIVEISGLLTDSPKQAVATFREGS